MHSLGDWTLRDHVPFYAQATRNLNARAHTIFHILEEELLIVPQNTPLLHATEHFVTLIHRLIYYLRKK